MNVKKPEVEISKCSIMCMLTSNIDRDSKVRSPTLEQKIITMLYPSARTSNDEIHHSATNSARAHQAQVRRPIGHRPSRRAQMILSQRVRVTLVPYSDLWFEVVHLALFLRFPSKVHRVYGFYV
jgi:hypothetical protein